MPNIKPGDLDSPEVIALLEAHLEQMRAQSPAESVHALDIEGLKAKGVTFWTLWLEESLVGCAALKALSPDHGEIKSMHVLKAHRGKGLSEALLKHILANARNRGMKRLSLETGAPQEFKPAQMLYAKYGFVTCPPFGDYKLDPFSLFMTLEIF